MSKNTGTRDGIHLKTVFNIHRFEDLDQRIARRGGAGYNYDRLSLIRKPFEVSQFGPNLALNEGLTALLNLLIGASETAFSNANAYTGVGDSSTSESASQTGLQATTNKLYKAMDSSYPQISNQQVIFRSTYSTSDANFAWNEFTVASGNSDSSDNLNRKVSAQGTKTNSQTWVLTVTLTAS